MRRPGRPGGQGAAKPAIQVTTGSDVAKPAIQVNPENRSNKEKAKVETSKPAIQVTTGFGVELSTAGAENPKCIPTASTCEPFREAIALGLSRGRNATAIWQDLVSESGFNGGYQTVKRFIRKLGGNQQPQPRAVILTAPGEEAQVDFGKGPMVRDPQSGKYRRTRLFVMTLGYSRKSV